MLVHSQLPLHHFLVVELKLNVTARWNVNLRLEGFHVLGVCPGKGRRVQGLQLCYPSRIFPLLLLFRWPSCGGTEGETLVSVVICFAGFLWQHLGLDLVFPNDT